MFRNTRSPAPLRFIKFTLLATGQPVYGIECARVNFVSRTNGFPLFSQIANVRTYTSTVGKGITPHCVSKCFIDVGDGIYQRVMTNGSASRLESNLLWNIFGRGSHREYYNLQRAMDIVLLTMDAVILCTSASYYVWYFGLPQHSWLPISE